MGVFYGGGQYLEVGRDHPILAYLTRQGCSSFHYALNGRNVLLEPVTGSSRVYAHRNIDPFFGYLTRGLTGLCGWPWASRRSPPLAFMSSNSFPEMASGYPDYNQRWGSTGFAGKSRGGPVVRRNRVLVRDDQEVTTIIVMIVVGLGVIFFGFGNGGQSIGFRQSHEHGGFLCWWLEGVPDGAVYCGGVLPGRGADWHYLPVKRKIRR